MLSRPLLFLFLLPFLHCHASWGATRSTVRQCPGRDYQLAVRDHSIEPNPLARGRTHHMQLRFEPGEPGAAQPEAFVLELRDGGGRAIVRTRGAAGSVPVHTLLPLGLGALDVHLQKRSGQVDVSLALRRFAPPGLFVATLKLVGGDGQELGCAEAQLHVAE